MTKFIEKDPRNDLEKQGLIKNSKTWMDMIKSRTLTNHTYNGKVADAIAASVIDTYYNERWARGIPYHTAPDAWGRRVIINKMLGLKDVGMDTAQIDELTYLLESG